jgi:hypothetical protein
VALKISASVLPNTGFVDDLVVDSALERRNTGPHAGGEYDGRYSGQTRVELAADGS